MTQTRTVEQQTAPEETNKAQITLNMLRQWGACQDGKSWFSAKFPQGAEDNSGYGARIEAIGENVVVSCSGKLAKVKIGKGGAACLNWHDGKRVRFVAIYEGEGGINAGEWYALDSNGAVYEVEAA